MAWQEGSGCLPGTNCCVAVPQDEYYTVERFGKYYAVVKPGLSFNGVDLCGWCIRYRKITARIEQIRVVVSTKTSDNVFVTAAMSVQLSVQPQRTVHAMYKLADAHEQIRAYVSDCVRSQVPRLSLDEAFYQKDAISEFVLRRLREEMDDFGFQIHQCLLTELQPDGEVVEAMNEISKQRRLRDAALLEAEAAKIRVVKAAEAAAEASCLQGEGTSRKRAAIVDGLRASLPGPGGEAEPSRGGLDADRVTALLLVTQYFDTIREVGAKAAGQTVFLEHGPGALGDVAMELRRGVAGGAGRRPPPEQAAMRDP